MQYPLDRTIHNPSDTSHEEFVGPRNSPKDPLIATDLRLGPNSATFTFGHFVDSDI